MVLQGQVFPMYALMATLTRVTAAQPSSALQMSQGCAWRCCLSLQQVRSFWIIRALPSWMFKLPRESLKH